MANHRRLRTLAAAALLAASGAACAQAGECVERGDLRAYPDLGQAATFTALEFSPDARLLLGAAHDGRLLLWDFADGRRALEVWEHRPFRDAVSAPRLAFAPVGRRFYAAALQARAPVAYRFDYIQAGGECAVRRSAYALRDLAEVSAVAVSPDGTL
ncbi:MAG: hypothetical protein WAO95_11225, partial [Burkholderiales bacterium]